MLHSSKILIFASLFLLGGYFLASQAFAQVSIVNIQTIPSQIHVGDSFRINATIKNNMPNAIAFYNGCQSPLSATFDNNVSTNQTMGCFAIYNVILQPGQIASVLGPSSGTLYTASILGATDANVTFSYTTKNTTQNTISKTFTFDILKSTTIPEFPYLTAIVFAISIFSIIMITRIKSSF